METKSNTKSRKVSLFLLVPALIFGIISAAMAYIGLGLIPLLPAAIAIILCILSLKLLRGSFSGFAKVVIAISILSALVSLFRSVIIKDKVAADTEFDSTMVETQQGVDTDLEDAFGDAFETDSTTVN